MAKCTQFVSGIPTDPDVRKLMEAFGKPSDGARYRTVTTAWRKKLHREHNIIVLADPGVGFKVATPDERVESGHSKMRTGQRITKRAFQVIGSTDLARVTPENRAQAERDMRVAKAVLTAARIESTKFKAALPGPEEVA